MWLSDISPPRAGTAGELSDNNFAAINLLIFSLFVNSFLTFSAQIWIFSASYNFFVPCFVIFTKIKPPLAVLKTASYTEFRGAHQAADPPLSKDQATFRQFQVCFRKKKLSDNTAKPPQNPTNPLSRGLAVRFCRPKKRLQPPDARGWSQHNTLSLFGYKNAQLITSPYPNRNHSSEPQSWPEPPAPARPFYNKERK